jgi:competence protein ComEC
VLLPDDTMLAGGNERSLLLHANAEDVSFLLTGDLPVDGEPDFVPDADVLKVAHHGSRNSTSDVFAAKASPSLALISVGKNNGYGHPHRRVLDALKGAQILRTDMHGCITLRLRNGRYRAGTFLNDSDR